jgi:ATP-dependent DNA helicase RecQ
LNGAVKDLFGLSYLYPYQRLVVANILEAAGAEEDGDRAGLGRQIVILPTGAGKSLCFQLPAALIGGPTLVIYPILGLMADQERRLKERGFSPVVFRGGQTREEREEIWEKLRRGESAFIIANPEVLLSPRILSRLGEIKIAHIVIDEAHCVSEWGESFRPSYLEIGRIIEAAAAPVVTAFTATASAPVLEKIERLIFGGGGAHRIIGNPDRANITYAAKGCLLRDLAVRDLLLENQRPAIVFCSSRTGTEKLARYLRNELWEMGAPWHGEVRFYHAGLSREEKKEVEGWFLHNGEAVLVSTCAFGLGIDKADVRTVIHRDCPPSVEAYLQESGRAGRDGEQSRAILLFGPDDEDTLRRARSGAERIRVSRLLDYARDTEHCRREALLRLLDYEGDGVRPETPCCDVCQGEAGAAFREEASVTGFFRRNRRAYTLDQAVSVLTRQETVRWTGKDARLALERLMAVGKLRVSRNPFWKDKLTVPSRGRGTIPPQ